MSEPEITINGVPLTDTQAMTIRVAIENFAIDLNDAGLGEDEHGKVMTRRYLQAIQEIRRAIFKQERV